MARLNPPFVAQACGYTTPCWVWLGHTVKGGYGKLKRRGQHWMAHRFYYTQAKGPIPDGLTLDHLCRTRRCVNPDHLEPVTLRANVLRGIGPTAVNARRHVCAQGHPLTGRNLGIRRQGTRKCRTCDRIAARAHARRVRNIPPERWRIPAA